MLVAGQRQLVDDVGAVAHLLGTEFIPYVAPVSIAARRRKRRVSTVSNYARMPVPASLQAALARYADAGRILRCSQRRVDVE